MKSYGNERGETMTRFPPKEDVLQFGQLLCSIESTKRLLSLECIGLIDFKTEDQIGYVYRLPGRLGKAKPMFPIEDTFIRMPLDVLESHVDGTPSLGWVFKVAKKLVASVVLLHASGWLHKNIRSESVVFFPKDGKEIGRGNVSDIDLDTPYLVGYGFSRRDDAEPSNVHPKSRDTAHQLLREERLRHDLDMPPPPIPSDNIDSREVKWAPLVETPRGHGSDASLNSRDWNVGDHAPPPGARHVRRRSMPNFFASPYFVSNVPDIYHHPAKRKNPQGRYRHAYDVYSLGIVLLEIGLGMPISSMKTSQRLTTLDPYSARRAIVREVVPRLKVCCGEIYAKAVLSCLSVDSSDDMMVLSEQRNLCAKVAADLSQCWA
jgi:serine/threonine protein kinase